ncbi:uncharacterized protein LOC126738957 isoform X2 [Anthonomus grandis grandis]|uniref:uncharacterized protein LOC126738957 isoform X2 n=1 Tax=Anthonomus grandis grandis TaxID=2921223 RepID=UPI002165C608|nr:uncharacterized protein LOC126738957 isoform X2 [Anthonomus grandis grandis]
MAYAGYCSVPNCTVRVNETAVFRCPKDPVRCQEWKESLGFIGEHKYANLTPEEAFSCIRICSFHFDDNCFTPSGKRLLKTAIPKLTREYRHIMGQTSGINEYNEKNDYIVSPALPHLIDESTQTDSQSEEKQTKQEDSEENTFQEQSDFRGECSSKAKLTTSDSFDQASEDSNFEPDETKVIIKEEPLDSDLDEIECKKIKIECESEEDCDEDLLFFKSLLPDFKLLSPEIKRELQGRIQEMVREATLSTTMHNF